DITSPSDHAEMDAIGFRIDAQVGVLPPEEFGNAFIHCRLREPHGFDIPSNVTSPVASWRRRGSTCSSHMGCISAGGPGIATIILPCRSTHHPGAVPKRFGRNCADGIRWACLILGAGMLLPRC